VPRRCVNSPGRGPQEADSHDQTNG
jgi:hypothetical protein